MWRCRAGGSRPVKLPITLILSPEREHSMTFFDLEVLLSEISNRDGFDVVAANEEVLRKAGIYERVLLDVFVGSPTNELPLSKISGLLARANRRKLRAAGNPLPSRHGPFLLYRGVAGAPPRRRVRGFSWTDSIESAKRFATRIPNLRDPAVYSVRVEAADVLAYVGGEEAEYLVQLPRTARPVRVDD
jgi:hypothetical protein